MGRIVAALVALGLVLAAGGVLFIYSHLGELEHEALTPDVHVIRTPAVGGNVAVLRSERGAVLVDTMYFVRLQGDRIRRLAEELTGRPVHAVINTHYHPDHTHGNPAFPAGLRVVATERTRAHLLELDGEYWQGDAADTLPNETLEAEQTLELGDKSVRLIPLRGHTDGDLAVYFVEDRVLHTGDLLFHGYYPNVDLEAGGSIPAWVEAIDRLSALDIDHVVPGHGPVTARPALRAYQQFLREVWQVASAAAREGEDLQDFLESAELQHDRGLRTLSFPFAFRFDRAFILRRAWQEATSAPANS